MNECKIVEDLLPLYAEELVSQETAEFICDHSARCAHCRKLMERCKADISVNTEDIPSYKKALKRERTLNIVIGALFATIVLAFALTMGVLAVGYAPIKLDKEPIILTSPDGTCSFQAEYYSSLLGTNQGLYVTQRFRNGGSEGTCEGWMEILDAQWSPDSTDLFLSIEMRSGETEMRIRYHNYDEAGNTSGGYFPHISYNQNKRDYNDLTAEFTKLLAQWEEFHTGWESITYEFEEWGEDSESAYFRYKTDNGHEGMVYFGFDFEGQAIWIIE